MPQGNEPSRTRELLVYFSMLALMVNLISPQYLLDIPTSYMLKNLLHASASQVSMFRLITGVPLYLGFAFGLVRDSWSPFGGRDPGYFRIFVPLMMLVLGWVALSPTTYIGLLFGMLLALISYGFLSAAFQGLLALVGQESLMPGRLSTLMNFSLNITIIAGAFASGWISAHLSPRQT